MTDITTITTAIAAMISTGTTERDLLAAVARKFPDLTRTEFVAALQDATAQAEREGVAAALEKRKSLLRCRTSARTPRLRLHLLRPLSPGPNGTRHVQSSFWISLTNAWPSMMQFGDVSRLC